MQFGEGRMGAVAAPDRSAEATPEDAMAESQDGAASAKDEDALAGIEPLRFVCAVAVLIWHYQHFMFVGPYGPHGTYGPYVGVNLPTLLATLPFSTPLWLFYRYGKLAVVFFWAISGLIFYHRYARLIGEGRIGVGTFMLRRFARLYPLHAATLFAVAALQWAYLRTHGQFFIYGDNSLHAFAGQLLMASNWFAWQHVSFDGPIWSVSVEVLIYVSFFLIARLFGARLLAGGLAAFGFLLLGSAGVAASLDSRVLDCGFIFFFAGALGYALLRLRFATLIAACAAIAIGALVAARGDRLLDEGLPLGVLTVCALVLFARLGAVAVSAVRPLTVLGQATYSSYLLHFPIQLVAVLVVDAAGIGREVFLRPSLFLSYLAGVVALSMLSYRYFEQPLRLWIRVRAETIGTRGKAAVSHQQLS
jgi:peptidoglycan/LPS O-acetylase OafA/YrhL